MNVAAINEPVVRPLGTLVALIKQDLEKLKQGQLEAKKSEQSIFSAIGGKLLEAKIQMSREEFELWVRKNFNFGVRASDQYIAISRATKDLDRRIVDRDRENEQYSFRKMVREVTENKNFGKPAAWRADIADNIRKAKADARRLEDERLSQAEERKAEKALAIRLIDIGFKVLAKELHPDRGGSKDAMVRLGKVRARLKTHA